MSTSCCTLIGRIEAMGPLSIPLGATENFAHNDGLLDALGRSQHVQQQCLGFDGDAGFAGRFDAADGLAREMSNLVIEFLMQAGVKFVVGQANFLTKFFGVSFKAAVVEVFLNTAGHRLAARRNDIDFGFTHHHWRLDWLFLLLFGRRFLLRGSLLGARRAGCRLASPLSGHFQKFFDVFGHGIC